MIARPPSRLYRLRKFCARRAAVVAASLVGIALLAGIVGTSLGLIEANRQRQLADGCIPARTERRSGITPSSGTSDLASNWTIASRRTARTEPQYPRRTSVTAGMISGTLNASPNTTYSSTSTRIRQRRFGRAAPGARLPDLDDGHDQSAGDAVFNVPYTPFPDVPILTATATARRRHHLGVLPAVGLRVTATGMTFAATTGVPFRDRRQLHQHRPAAMAADFTATINYGDGTPTSPGTIVAAPGGFIVVGSHTYSTANPVTPVTVTITDTSGGSQATASSMANVDQSFDTRQPVPAFVAGTLYSRVVASFTDSEPTGLPRPVHRLHQLGRWVAPLAGTVSADGSGFDVTGSHTYNFASSSTVTEPVTVTITDTLTGATVTANSTATITPAAITLTAKNFTVEGGVNVLGDDRHIHR